jgi:hypothetical protein
MAWARRLKRVFNFDVTVCEACSGPVRVIACIEDPRVIDAILTHLAKKEEKEFLENTPPGLRPY